MRFYFTIGLGILGILISFAFQDIVEAGFWDGFIAGGIIDIIRGQYQTTPPSSIQRYLK
ncbi:hypothetical protein G4V62_13545 [Bacillaceae bacterium SIJ1]|uniref:hypothetical protein n=1 Tax=Litoribacterium kuwaitense TaxID=1398745 RepID=UPI0013EB4DB0|nr:hypothetical protein [Litoribacterium kuwaitense]NGP45919.1 hypothetical protein [Litoribacterium kuwaitense]